MHGADMVMDGMWYCSRCETWNHMWLDFCPTCGTSQGTPHNEEEHPSTGQTQRTTVCADDCADDGDYVKNDADLDDAKDYQDVDGPAQLFQDSRQLIEDVGSAGGSILTVPVENPRQPQAIRSASDLEYGDTFRPQKPDALENVERGPHATKEMVYGKDIDRIQHLPEDQQLQSSGDGQIRDGSHIDGVSRYESPLVDYHTLGYPPLQPRKQPTHQEHRPTQSDGTSIRELDPNRSNIAHAVSHIRSLDRKKRTYDWMCVECGSPSYPSKKCLVCDSSPNQKLSDRAEARFQLEVVGSNDMGDESVDIVQSQNVNAHNDENLERNFTVLEPSSDNGDAVKHFHSSEASSVATDVHDCQSVRSAESSTTLVSTLSGLTMVELAGATDELQKVFQEDLELVRIYRQAIKDTAIGPERLQRNLGRLLRLFARNLRYEAKQELEKMTCRFVSLKARYIAHCIIEKLNDTHLGQHPRHNGVQQSSRVGMESRDDDDQHEVEDPDELAPVDEDIFEDLTTLRAFLVNSAAFQVFRKELSKFVLPKELQAVIQDDSTRNFMPNASLTKNWHSSHVMRITRAVLLAMGCMEPPLQAGMSRLRWQCRCGDTFFEDVTEYRAGGVSELVAGMRSSCIKITATAYGEVGSQQAYFPALLNGLRATWRKILDSSKKCSTSPEEISQNLGPQIIPEDIEASSATPPTESLFLLAGVHRSQSHTYLAQDNVEKVKTDRQLFCFMRRQLNGRYNYVQRLLSMTRVKNIHFTKLCLRVGDNLEVRTHDPCCTGQPWNDCECVPPASRVEGGHDPEYRCNPAGPLKRWPPVLSRYLVHRLEDPSCVHEDDKTVLQKIPRRIRGEIKAEADQEAEGWGIYYEEGPNLLWVAVLTMTVFCLTGLLFGILWGVLREDLQGAFGVSGFLAAVCAGAVPLFAWVQNS